MKLLPRSILALSAALPLTLALAGEAHAGTLQVRDDVNVLTPADEAALRAQVDAQPFDVRVWTTDTALDRAAFDARVSRLVASQRMVVIAVDPTHHRTSVHFGIGAGVPRERFAAIGDAGDASFRAGQWRAGVSAIIDATRANATVTQAQRQRAGFPWGLVLLGVGTIAGVALLVRFVRGRANQMGGYPGTNPNAPGYYQPGPGYPPQGGGYGPNFGPGYGPGPGYGGGSGVGAGLVGAGLGGLAGYALGSAMANREQHHAADHNASNADTGGFSDGGGNDFDAGGSTSDWGGGDGGGDFGGGGGGDW